MVRKDNQNVKSGNKYKGEKSNAEKVADKLRYEVLSLDATNEQIIENDYDENENQPATKKDKNNEGPKEFLSGSQMRKARSANTPSPIHTSPSPITVT
ncbi:hypothetical protein AHAS_Ahas12G0152700 [Arachis hypogaea]